MKDPIVVPNVEALGGVAYGASPGAKCQRWCSKNCEFEMTGAATVRSVTQYLEATRIGEIGVMPISVEEVNFLTACC